MQNLAGKADCDVAIEQELTRTGIEVVRGTRSEREVPASITGKLGAFTFVRCWYYWAVRGNVPIEVARELYGDPVGKRDIRVAGHCGCPSPDEGWAEWKMPDGRQVVPKAEEEQLQKFIERGTFNKTVLNEYVFSDDPASLGAKQYVTSYHIDSELGLYKFAEAIKRHGLA